MAVLHYATEWGSVIFVEDDNAYTYAQNMAQNTNIELINDNGVEQTILETYKEVFHFSDMFLSIIYNDSYDNDTSVLSKIYSIFPNAAMVAMPLYEEAHDFELPFEDDSYTLKTRITYSVVSGSIRRMKQGDHIWLTGNNVATFESWNSHGGFIADLFLDIGYNRAFSFEFIVTNSQHTGFICLCVASFARAGYQWEHNGIRISKPSYSGMDRISEISVFMNTVPPLDPTAEYDPYSEGGESGEDGGEGTFDHTGDDVDIPNLPSVSATDAGFITLFNPSSAQLLNLANYMWGTGFDLDTFKKIFANPMDCILGLSIVPVAVPNGGTATVKVGNISTGVSMTKAASQYVSVDCGSLTVKEYWGAYLDYDPYTKMEIYLPYIGTHPIRADDVMGKTIKIVYHIDILSGACTAYIKCGNSVLYEFIGQCSSSIPITSNDWTNVVNGVLSIAGAIGSMVATGGASAPATVPSMVASAINTFKPNIEKSGSMSGTGGMLAIQKPYLIMTFPRQALPKNQNKFVGYPSYITESLDSLSGYTEIESIHLQNVPATIEELNEIEGLLKGGVIF